MTGHSVKSNEEMVSEFITVTCQLFPKSHTSASDHMHYLSASRSLVPKEYCIVSGSVAEFYIRPLQTCIGDIDYLMCRADELFCVGEFPVLPSDRTGLADMIRCYTIESNQKYPGFVHLRVLGELNYNWIHKRYEFNQTCHPCLYTVMIMSSPENANIDKFLHDLYNRTTLPKIVSGPSFKCNTDSHFVLAFDSVKGIFCPQWPREAKHWPVRSRKYGWPTNDTISEVVQNGCHAVYAQHRVCREDDLQWRLSFSVAEVILLQSWTQIQQIVYHLLRFFAKRELIQKDCKKEDEVLYPYHLKTLMLWTCEEMPPEWWHSSSVIAICCKLLKLLSEWLKRRHFPNYFIPEANLFYLPLNSTQLHQIGGRLNKFQNSGTLSHWFLENYILPIIRTQFEFLYTCTRKAKPDFMDYMAPLLEYRKIVELQSLDLLFSRKFSSSSRMCWCMIKHGLSSGMHQSLKVDQYRISPNPKMHSTIAYLPITKESLCFIHYVNLLYILNNAYGLRYGHISWDSSLFVEFMKAISMHPKVIRSQHHNYPKTYLEQSGQFQFQRAQDLMRNITESNCHCPSEFQILSLLSKEFLRKSFKYDDCRSDYIAPAAAAYLTALHFARSEYKQAMRICLAAIADQTSETDKETLNAGCLLLIDGVARIVGLCVLHRKITDNNLHYIDKRLYLDLRLSPKVFAHYLAVWAAERMSKYFDLQHNLTDSVFPMDKYLKASIKPKCIEAMELGNNFITTSYIVYRRIDSLTDITATSANPAIVKDTVISALMEYAVENMTSFYSVIRKDFGIHCNTADCYRASYLYKCRKYDEALHLCKQILHDPDLQRDLKEFSLTNILLMPPLDSFFDGDVQSLLGFHTLVYFLSPNNDEMRKIQLTPDSTFDHWFSNDVYFRRKELSSFLALGYSIASHYFLGRHFLGRYLKVRCCIDCNLPYTDAMMEFVAHRANLPFERIIRRFLQRKLRTRKD